MTAELPTAGAGERDGPRAGGQDGRCVLRACTWGAVALLVPLLALFLALATQWMMGYPVFKERHSDNLGTLRQRVAACEERGFYPVLGELPRNLPIVGSA